VNGKIQRRRWRTLWPKFGNKKKEKLGEKSARKKSLIGEAVRKKNGARNIGTARASDTKGRKGVEWRTRREKKRATSNKTV